MENKKSKEVLSIEKNIENLMTSLAKQYNQAKNNEAKSFFAGGYGSLLVILNSINKQ